LTSQSTGELRLIDLKMTFKRAQPFDASPGFMNLSQQTARTESTAVRAAILGNSARETIRRKKISTADEVPVQLSTE
jgi:hypothetical protein